MKLLLTRTIQGVGERGELVEVSDGYAMNFLIPKGFAEVATAKVIERYRAAKAKKDHERETRTARQAEDAKRLSHVRITVVAAAAPTGRLFAAVSPASIVRELTKQGFEVEEKSVILPHRIDTLGEHEVSIRLAANLESTIQLTVINDHHGA